MPSAPDVTANNNTQANTMKSSKDLVVGDNVYLAIDRHFGPGGFTKVSKICDGKIFFRSHPGLSMTIGDSCISNRSGEVAGRMDGESIGWSDKEVAEDVERTNLINLANNTVFCLLDTEKLKQIANILATP